MSETRDEMPDDLRRFMQTLQATGGRIGGPNAVEKLIEVTFALRDGGGHDWQINKDLALPGNPDVANAPSLAAIKLPGTWKNRVMDLGRERAYTFSWSYSNRPESIITFIFMESHYANPEVALRLLTTCFLSAQEHRRALGIRDGLVFGATLHNHFTLKFYASKWDGNNLTVGPAPGLRTYNLEHFNEFFDLYFVLCRISDWQSKRLKEEFEKWDNNVASHMQTLRRSAENPWRKEKRRGRKRD